MSHWFLNKAHFEPINNAFFPYLKDNMVVVVDGGAAGGLSEPFNVSPKIVKSIRFEPRGKDEVSSSDNEIFIDGGIWSSDCIRDLHIARIPTTSSVCPPDLTYLSKFDELNVGARRTDKIIEVNMRSIDSCIESREMPSPDFIKLDVHSAELPALKGSQQNIDNCLGILVETWHTPVHVNQGLHFQIEEFAIQNGFEVYDIVCAARWKHKYHDKIDFYDRGQYIGSEILFIKTKVNQNQLIKKAFILCLFGYANHAKLVLQDMKDDIIKAKLLSSIEEFQLRRRRSLKLNLKRLIFQLSNLLGKVMSFIK